VYVYLRCDFTFVCLRERKRGGGGQRESERSRERGREKEGEGEIVRAKERVKSIYFLIPSRVSRSLCVCVFV